MSKRRLRFSGWMTGFGTASGQDGALRLVETAAPGPPHHRHRGRHLMLGGLSPRRRLLVVGVAAAVVAGGGIVVGLRLAGGARPAGGAGPGVVPVVLVPGYGGTPASLATLAGRLRGLGRPVLVVSLPERGRGTLDASVGALDRAVDQGGTSMVDLVGFSAGAIVVRLWLRRGDNASRARTVVLLGGPNHGTALAGLVAGADATLCVDTCADLAPGSGLLARLNAGDETPPGPRYVSVWTERDQTVIPPVTASLGGATNVRVQDVCADARFGHGGLVRDPLALGLVVRAVEGGLDRAPGPADCLGLRTLGAAGG